MKKNLEFWCDNKRHLICKPYSIANLHKMSEELDVKKCWFHKTHYDIPKRRVEEIKDKCKTVTEKEIVEVIKAYKEFMGIYNNSEIAKKIGKPKGKVMYFLNSKEFEKYREKIWQLKSIFE